MTLQIFEGARAAEALQIFRGRNQNAPAASEGLNDQPLIVYRPMANRRVVAFAQDVNEPIVEVERQSRPGYFARRARSAGPKCSCPKLTGAEMRNGPTRVPRRFASSEAALSTSRKICFARL